MVIIYGNTKLYDEVKNKYAEININFNAKIEYNQAGDMIRLTVDETKINIASLQNRITFLENNKADWEQTVDQL